VHPQRSARDRHHPGWGQAEAGQGSSDSGQGLTRPIDAAPV